MTRAVEVLGHISHHGPRSLAELARRLGIPKSSLLGICQTLVDDGFLSYTTDGRYRLGLGLAELADAQRSQPTRPARIGLTVQNLTNPFFTVEVDAITAAAAELGAEVILRDAGQDVATQCEHLSAFVATPVDAIILDAVHSADVAGAITSAQDAGIPVVAVNVGAARADATITTDNVQAGQVLARYVGRLLNGTGAVAIVDGLPVTAVRDRVVGFISTLREFPGITVARRVGGDHSVEGGEHAAKEMLDHTVPDAIFTINDPTALGVLNELHARNLTVPVVSVDGAAAAVQSIIRGEPLVATAAQDPRELGRLAVIAATDLHAGRPFRPRTRLLPTNLITAETVPTYEPWG
ncbi:substrate-binding domain-containing protein [Phytoactinopolyspora halotolerans]|uniref:Substrate-binding domain-containing protein n=1 Tax=Phytoactinopolyspora halotolerans TaxID=1981512 RepID=A0A6L9SE67_9ACTN|nr:substrate-binding domain-containing protein [Phytoactinopolyspora halotolerans]NEE03705.1 substrate-binding domain-containing protein [Phytoactinopolyspora halotolerans]